MGDRPELPDPNLYGSLETPLNAAAVANLFGDAGWDVRKCSWTDYDLVTDWAELIIEPSEGALLLHGSVLEAQADGHRVAKVLRQARITFSLECYAGDRLLEMIVEPSS